MTVKLRVQEFEERLVPAIAIDSAYETYAWVFINTLRQDPDTFADNLDGLRTRSVASAFGFANNDPIIDDLRTMIGHAGVPAHYGQALALMRSTAAAGPLAWDDFSETRAGVHNEWMKVNGFAHVGDNSPGRSAIPGFTSSNAAADTYGYPDQYSAPRENIGYAVGMLRGTKDAYDDGDINLAGLQQRAAFLDTVAYMLELNSSSLGHLQTLLGPSLNVIGTDTDLYEAPSPYEAQDGVAEAYLSTHRLAVYRPSAGGFVTGVVFTDVNGNNYFDVGEGSAVTVDVRNAGGAGFTDTLTATHHGAFAGYVANGTYTVTISVAGDVIDTQSVTINNSNAWAGLMRGGLGRPTIATPIGAQGSLRPAVNWNVVDGATSYQVRVDDLTTGATNLFNFASTTGTNWSPTADLVAGRSYRVWVRAVQDATIGEWSVQKDFSVAVPTRIGPSGVVTSLRPTFTWSSVTGATYQIRIDDVSAAKNNIFPGLSTTTTSWDPTADLVSGRSYRWQIRAVNAAGLGSWSPFTTFSIARPAQSGPIATIVNIRPQFTWGAISGATAYEIRVNDVSAAKSNLFPATRVTGVNWTPPADLVSGRSYKWQIRAVNALGLGTWSTLKSFAVARPTLTAPIGDVTDRTPTLTWSTIAGATSYEVVLTDLTTGKRVVKQIVADTNWTPATDLVAGHRYRWWVRAMNTNGLGAWSVFKDFRVV